MSVVGEYSENLIHRIWDLLDPVIRSEGMEILEVEYRRESPGWVLRLFIDQDKGVDVEDCARVSRIAGDLLDVADIIPNAYHLEVSSPGLNRPLRKWEHFHGRIGRTVEIRASAPLEGRRNFKGLLTDADSERVVIDCGGKVYEIPLSMVERARLCWFESRDD